LYRYLFLTEPTYLLIQNHIRYTRHDETNWTDEPDIRIAFPRLVLIFTMNNPSSTGTGFSASASVDLYQPIPVDVLLERCRWEDDTMVRMITFFGVGFGGGNTECGLGRLSEQLDINEIQLKGSGCLLSPLKGANFIRTAKVTVEEGATFNLDIEAEVETSEVEGTMKMLLAYLGFVIGDGSKAVYLDIVCSPAVFESFIRVVSHQALGEVEQSSSASHFNSSSPNGTCGSANSMSRSAAHPPQRRRCVVTCKPSLHTTHKRWNVPSAPLTHHASRFARRQQSLVDTPRKQEAPLRILRVLRALSPASSRGISQGMVIGGER
jgi:hypothetical protein